MKKYKMIVAYDGTDFHGWQIQPSDVTIVSTLQKTFYKTFNKEVIILGASRTDAGVHALGQVALCTTKLDLDPVKIKHAWNNALPNSIMIRSFEVASSDFYPFAYVVSKTYYYHLFYKQPLPHIARYGWFWKSIDSVDWKKFSVAIKLFVGTHDFCSFCKDEEEQTTIRTIDSITIKRFERFGTIRVAIIGKGFLRYQIRRMIGAALDVASKPSMQVDFIQKQLDHPSDQQEFTKAQSCGLCLRKIRYHRE